MFDKRDKLDTVLKELVGYQVHLSLSTRDGASLDLNGKLEAITNEYILIKESPLNVCCWLNKNSMVLNSVRLLSTRKKRKKANK